MDGVLTISTRASLLFFVVFKNRGNILKAAFENKMTPRIIYWDRRGGGIITSLINILVVSFILKWLMGVRI